MTRGDSETITVSCPAIPFATGDKITFTVRKTAASKEKIIEKIITVFDEGKAVIEIAPADTAELRFGSYLYDIQLTRADGTVTTLIKPAAFSVREEVSYGG